MLKAIQNVSLLDILPDNILADEQVNAAARALDSELQAVTAATVETLHLPRIDVLPEKVLDLLAWQWHVDFYEPIGMDIATKRNLIKNSIAWHRMKGTPAAVEAVVSAAFDKTTVKEWYEYDGSPGYFKIITEDVTTEKDKLDAMRRAVDTVKNTRSWLEKIEFILHLTDKLSPSGKAALNAILNDIELYPWRGRYFDGTWNFTPALSHDGTRTYDGAWKYDGITAGDEGARNPRLWFTGERSFTGSWDFSLSKSSRKVLFDSFETDQLSILMPEFMMSDGYDVLLDFHSSVRKYDGTWKFGRAGVRDESDITANVRAADHVDAREDTGTYMRTAMDDVYPLARIRKMDGTWKYRAPSTFDGELWFGGESAFNGIPSLPEPVEEPSLLDGRWRADGTRNFDVPSPVAEFDADEDRNDVLTLSHAFRPMKETVRTEERENTKTECLSGDHLPRMIFDGRAAMDGTYRHDAAYVETSRSKISTGTSDELRHAAIFDGSMDFTGGLLDGKPGPDETCEITVSEGRWFTGRWLFDGDTDTRHAGGYSFDGSVLYGRKRREAAGHDGSYGFDGSHGYRWEQGTYEQFVKGAA